MLFTMLWCAGELTSACVWVCSHAQGCDGQVLRWRHQSEKEAAQEAGCRQEADEGKLTPAAMRAALAFDCPGSETQCKTAGALQHVPGPAATSERSSLEFQSSSKSEGLSHEMISRTLLHGLPGICKHGERAAGDTLEQRKGKERNLLIPGSQLG